MSQTYPGGYAGKILRVDLTKEQLSEVRLDEATLRKYLGGSGIGAKFLYEEVPPGVEWSDPENRVILASGPLGGTAINGSGTTVFVTKGCLTNGAVATSANGSFGAFLKFSGFDGVILQGAAKRPVYLYLHDGIGELRDASHLKGKDTWQTVELICAELDKREQELSVACIGPAGENLVKCAGVIIEKGHVAAKNGIGAVIGSKGLKAIAVERGKSAVPVKDKAALAAVAKEMYESIKNTLLAKWGVQWLYTPSAGKGHLIVKNYTTNVFPQHASFTREVYGTIHELHFHPCWACKLKHHHYMTIRGGPHTGFYCKEPEFSPACAYGAGIGNTSFEEAAVLINRAERLGMDANETGNAIAMVMEMYEKGLLTSKDTDGLQMTWGNVQAVMAMLSKIAHREGFGDVLAEGVMRAAKRIGGEATNIGVYTLKGGIPRSDDVRPRWAECLDWCTSNMGELENVMGQTQFPKERFSVEDVAAYNARHFGKYLFIDTLGMCEFNVVPTAEFNFMLEARAMGAATGWDFTPEECIEVGRRVGTLFRMFNFRHGLTAEMEAPSPRMASAPADGPMQGIPSIAPVWSQLKSRYYELMGWDKNTGKPLPETLRKLGLEHTI